jgi:hypothetical protein
MQSLAMLRQSYDTGILQKHGWLLNGELVELGNGSDVLHDNPTEGGNMCVSLAAYSETTEKMSHISFPVKYDAKGDVLVSSTDARALASPFSDFNLFDPGFQYLRADRVTPSVIYPKSQHAVGTRRFLGSRGEFTDW